MSKEKFELMFLGGGMLLDLLGQRLRRDPATPREDIGAAMHSVTGTLDPTSPAAAELRLIRADLCAEHPDPVALVARVRAFAADLPAGSASATSAARLRAAVESWFA